ncbi:MAG: DnaJ domain-containing protein [Sphingomicrobium sp.]
MGGDRTAYEVLGLPPGADRRAIEQAYRRLIKEHHPDRAGGDAGRAAEITRAYRDLRASDGRREALEFHPHPVSGTISRGWQALALAVAIVLLSLSILAGGSFDTGFGPRAQQHQPDKPAGAVAGGQPDRNSPIAQPIDLVALEETVNDVSRMFSSQGEYEFAGLSRACHQAYRLAPDIRKFDRCVAFDDAVIILQDRDPLRDQGPFREVAVVRRHWSEGMMLTSDGWALDSRLDRIRLRVELLLAPRIEPETRAPDAE